MSNTTTSSGIGLSGAMFLLFLGLRLTDYIDWAWYWVAAPLWISVILWFVVLAIILITDARRARRLRRLRHRR